MAAKTLESILFSSPKPTIHHDDYGRGKSLILAFYWFGLLLPLIKGRKAAVARASSNIHRLDKINNPKD